MKKIFSLCPVRHVILFAALFIILAHIFMRRSYELMHYISAQIVQPLNQFMSRLMSFVSFSVAELFIAVLVIGFIIYLLYMIFSIARHRKPAQALYKLSVTAVMLLAAVYAGFCMLWGCYFYDDSFAEKSGLDDGPVSVEKLEAVTNYFAQLANHYSELVQRDENSVYTVDRHEIIDKSQYVYENTEELFACIEGPEVKVKGIEFSRIMSLIDFTGFYFPLTGEANVNMDFPPSLFASTVAHEISHQRGVCREQESNFLAVVSSLEYGDVDYCYSACLLAYTHLGNALYKADYEAWEKVYTSLKPEIHIDFAYNRAYWDQFETPVQTVSNAVYENFMYSYDQDMGLKSYGACVDLLVNYYYEKAAAVH